MKKPIEFNGRFWIDRHSHVFLGPGRIQLLEQIQAGHSIAQAARQLGMGYKTAWDMLNTMNNLAEEPLVIRSKGGRHGGGTTLTDYGKDLIHLYRTVEKEHLAMLLALEQRFPKLSHWQTVGQRLQLRTSARNQLFCEISALEKHGQRIIVKLHLGAKQYLYAQLTQTSVDEMALTVGRQVVALIKASSISLPTEATPVNLQLQGTLSAVNSDIEGNSEAEITLKSGHVLIAAVDNNHNLTEINSLVNITIDPKQVIVAVLD